MKDSAGREQGPRIGWGQWRDRKNKAIAKPRKNHAVERLEKLNRKADPKP